MANTQRFRLMELPKEIRLMVYERLPRKIVRTRVDLPANNQNSKPVLVLLTRTCSLALLRVSRMVNDEAKTIVRGLISKWILAHPLRVISSHGIALNVLDRILAEALYSHKSNSRYTYPSWLYHEFRYCSSLIDNDSGDGIRSGGCIVRVKDKSFRLIDLFRSEFLRSRLFQFKEQSSRLSNRGATLQAEFIIVRSRPTTAAGTHERDSIAIDLCNMHSLVNFMVSCGGQVKIPAILARDAADTMGLETTKALGPGMTMAVRSEWLFAIGQTDPITQDEWLNGWASTS